ncbi:MAG: hypothetical protein NT087_12865 [Deltaproteobacteria bacterium]|nr:hypothetical protein [Deltaproteobacteria bacterium]
MLLIQPPFKRDELEKIEEINKEADFIISPYDKNILNPYSIESYLFQKHFHSHQINAVFDSNIIIDLTGYAEDMEKVSTTTISSVALLAFLQIALVEIDPGIAISEHCTTCKKPSPSEKLFLFRNIDNFPTQELLDLVLGKIKHIDSSNTLYRGPIKKIIRPERPEELHRWKVQYIYALKLYILANSGLNKFDKVYSFIYWMWEKYLSGAVAFSFMAVFFSERYSNMLKGVFSPNSTNSMLGVKNAAWDMTTTHYWSSCVAKRKDNDPFYIFCTADKALKEVARHILEHTNVQPNKENLFHSLFHHYLSKSEIKELISLKEDLDEREFDPIRNVEKHKKHPDFFDNYLKELEKEAEIIMMAKPN